MLHHVSFNARDPQRAARILASLLDAAAVRLPSPPFPAGSWCVVSGDAQGSMLELIPWGHVLDAAARGGMLQDREMRPRTGSHVLASTPRSTDTVLAIAEREGLCASPTDAGLFQFTKVWVEDALLVELLTPQQIPGYLGAFGAGGVATLDARFRELERTVERKLKALRSPAAG
jgi:hypothetical protein